MTNDEQHSTLNTAHRNYEKKMNFYASFKVGDSEVGKDLVQNTFVKTWGYLVKGGKIDTMKAFLYHILNNLIVDEYRKKKTVSLDALLDNGYEPSVEYSERLFDQFDGKIALRLIKYLSLKYQKVVRMRYFQGLSLKEMSLITGQTKNTMAVQAHRGLEKLKILYNHGKNNL